MRLIFAGTPEIAALALEEIAAFHEVVMVITRPDAPTGRKRIVTPSPVALVAEKLQVPTLKTNKLGEDQILEIQKLEAQLAVVVAFGSLIPKTALKLFPWWNLHFSLLPAWRGATPLQHSMIHDSGAGITIFELEVGLDTGPIISQRAMSFQPGEVSGEALARFTKVGTELLLEALSKKPAPKPQFGEASFAPKIERTAAKLDFSNKGESLAATINALNPEPGAWTEIAGQPIKLLRARSATALDNEGISTLEVPGSAWLNGDRVYVACGQGTVFELLEVQPAGKKQMAATDWIRGAGMKVQFV